MRGATAALALVLAVAGPATPGHAWGRSFLCFFDRDSASPTRRCQEIVLEFFQVWERANLAQPGSLIQVQGHADAEEDARDGGSRLSAERAHALVALLRQHGVPGPAIRVYAHGAGRLLVPGPPTVPKPQNRRAEIVLTGPHYRQPPLRGFLDSIGR